MTTERLAAGQELVGQQVAVTGRMASMTRRDVAGLIERHGGRFSPQVNRQTTVVVVGREGWPLQPDGRLSRKLQRAHELRQKGSTPEVVPEERFLRSLDLPHLASEVCQSYTLGELTRLLDVPRRRIEAWQRNGLLTPTGAHYEIPCFDFRQVAAARSLLKLLNGGVQPRRLVRSLWQLRAWFSADDGVGDLLGRLLHDGGRIVFRTDAGRLTETTGQLLFEFESNGDGPTTVAWRSGADSDRLFEEAVQLEQKGQLEEAARCYRQLLLDQGPDADVCFNLANTLHALGEVTAAIERLHEAVSIDRGHVDAWNNLGNLLAEAGRLAEAAEAYHRAVTVEPGYADARYGLADVLDQLGRFDEARLHWRAYLQQEPVGACADYARTRLATKTA